MKKAEGRGRKAEGQRAKGVSDFRVSEFQSFRFRTGAEQQNLDPASAIIWVSRIYPWIFP
jgi:hypothetical protein